MDENQLIKAFVGRSLRYVVETELVGFRTLAKTLDEIRRNAGRGTSQLRCQREQLVLWK
jgi:hypothetical protein